ncbi:hypothetical protein CYMTET_17212 [Cymbomonas tetramitiformis]|uniref:Uncharacterized protein n=1 Tax=Cymbomonas tetramitiformis TaxID=36881 RepID=A0AAE0GAQ9_9CHLO|nr:hypothetical protein CYMTET_17212 [Cymbomonas tetramitiformis]
MATLATPRPGTAPPAAAQPATAPLGQARQQQAFTQSAQATPPAVPHQTQQQDPTPQQPLPADRQETQHPQQQHPTEAAAAYSNLPPPADWSDEEECPALRDSPASQQWGPPTTRDSLTVFHTPNPYHALQIEPYLSDSPASHMDSQAVQPAHSSPPTPQADPDPTPPTASSRLAAHHWTPMQQARHSYARSR